MKRQVLWSATSRAEVIDIGRHIARDSPMAAREVMRQLREAGEALGTMATGRPGRVSSTYEKVVARLPYIIAYEFIPYEQGEAVAILHVIHGARNWQPEEWPSG